MALKFLLLSATQGSADAFVEAEGSTGLSNVTRTAYRIRSIEWVLPILPGAADCFIQAVLRRNSAASISMSASNAVIAACQRAQELTTSGIGVQELFPNRQVYDRDMELLIVEESLFLDVDSNGTSASNAVLCRIGYETRTITENERLSVLSLTAQ